VRQDEESFVFGPCELLDGFDAGEDSWRMPVVEALPTRRTFGGGPYRNASWTWVVASRFTSSIYWRV
jgi:hypothetical protein